MKKNSVRIDKIRLTCIKEKDVPCYTVYSDQIPGLVVQVDKIEDAPKELAKSFEVMLMHGFDEGWHAVYELGSD